MPSVLTDLLRSMGWVPVRELTETQHQAEEMINREREEKVAAQADLQSLSQRILDIGQRKMIADETADEHKTLTAIDYETKAQQDRILELTVYAAQLHKMVMTPPRDERGRLLPKDERLALIGPSPLTIEGEQ